MSARSRPWSITLRYPQLPRQGGPRLCCGPVNRGVALYDGRVYVGLLDMRLVALDDAGRAAADPRTWDR